MKKENFTKDMFIKFNIVPKIIEENEMVFWCLSYNQNTENSLRFIYNKDILFDICTEEELDFHAEEYFKSLNSVDIKENLDKLNNIGIYEETVNFESKSVIIDATNSIIESAIRNKCSDIHVDARVNDYIIRFRKDGVLFDFLEIKRLQAKLLINRIKILSGLDYTITNMPQDGRIEFKKSNKKIDIRVAIIPTSNGEKLVLRILDKTSVEFTKEGIGLSGGNLEIVNKLIKQPNGLILSCGPTGSGKSSTIYTLLNSINERNINIVTIEDPVEYKINGINQVEINEDIGFDFNLGLKSILRLDPDKIMIGEIRDVETALTALRASITGHLVFSTVHTNSSPAAIYRLKDMGVAPYLLSAGIIGVISQRLVRKLCSCKIKEKKYVDIYGEEMEIYRSGTCEKCTDGYSGRTSVFEILVIDDILRDAIIKEFSLVEFKELAIERGMISLKASMKELLLNGVTSLDEVYKNIDTIGVI